MFSCHCFKFDVLISFSAFSISGLHTECAKPTAKWKCGIICLKNRTRVPLKVLKYILKSFFFSTSTSPLTCYGDFTCYFNVNNVKIKNKILLLEWILSFILILCHILCPLSCAPHELSQHLKCYRPWTSFAYFTLCKSLRTEKCKCKNKYNSIKHKCNLHCEIIETTQFVFCSSYTLMYFVLPRTMEMLNKSTSTVFF